MNGVYVCGGGAAKTEVTILPAPDPPSRRETAPSNGKRRPPTGNVDPQRETLSPNGDWRTKKQPIISPPADL